jgi:hypothetical protein
VLKKSGTGNPPLAKKAEQRIRVLQKELRSDNAQAEQTVRELERAQLFHAVVSRLRSEDDVMPEIAHAQVRHR